MRCLPTSWIPLLIACCISAWSTPGVAQFDDIPVPPAMATLEFMIGSWTVEGTFRTPDHVHPDRTLWYLMRDGGITRFDGRTWEAFAQGQSPLADSILAQTRSKAAPFEFSNRREVRWIQDGFAILIDEGRTSGSTVIFFDTSDSTWVATAFHAPTNGVNTSTALWYDGLPVFEGRATDRRGERIFRRRYEPHDADHYTIRTDVSFDSGVTWIEDQIRQEVRRVIP